MDALQNKLLHALLAQTGLSAQKQSLVSSFSNGRTTSSSNMHPIEAIELINYLKQQLPPIHNTGLESKADKMRKKIISLAWQMNWTYTNTNRRVVCDMKRINDWCVKYGYLHKPLMQYSYEQLPRLLTQFENVYHSYLNAI